jgi:probable HAF family extracellular repeat protein
MVAARELFVIIATASTAFGGTIVDLGSFGNGQAVAYRINNSGLAVGWSDNSSGQTNGFGSNGNGSPFNYSATLNGAESYVYGVNSAGDAAGLFYSGSQSHGAIWVNGSIIDLGAGSAATAINDSGMAVGGNGQAFVYSHGQMQDLGTLAGGSWSAAYGINASGEVVGYGSVAGGAFRGFYWTGKNLISIGTLGGASSYAMDVNDSGEIVGDSTTASGYVHAFLDTGGSLQDLGTLGGSSSFAYDVNNSGLVVGYSTVASGATHAFLYENGRMTDLNTLLPNGSGWVLVEAYGVNDSGQIVGSGLYNGHEEAFRFDLGSGQVVPEPGALTLFAMGAGILALLIRLRRRVPADATRSHESRKAGV